jgi:hypothetical protein
MTRNKWIVATAALAMALSAGAFAENQPQRNRRDDDARYTQQYRGDRDDARNNAYWNNGYRGNSGDNDDRGYRDRDDGGYYGRQDGSRYARSRDYRGHNTNRHDRDDHSRDRD